MELNKIDERKLTKTKKIILVTISIISVTLLVLTSILFNRIQTISSIEKIGGDLYTVSYKADYKLNDILENGISNVGELEEFVSKNLLFGYPIKTKENLFGCSAFAVRTESGKKMVGRNFDYARSGALLVYTEPKDGYKSYSMVSLSHIGVSKEEGTMPETLRGKISILAAPYAAVDGLNEKGLSVSVLELQTEPTSQNNEKKDIITTIAVRMLLDKCATTEEAVAMLGDYDMHSLAGKPYHFLITDLSGNTVIVDWAENQMNVINQNFATNFQLSEGKNYKVGIGHDRYDILKSELDKKSSVLSLSEAMELLEKVSMKWNGEWQTEWSIVYNLDDFSVDISNDMDYDFIYHLPKN